MKSWSSWLPDLLPQLPECPIPIVEHELKRAAQKFFADSRAWNVTLVAIPVMAGAIEVAIAPTDSAQDLVRINQAWYDGQSIDLESADAMAGKFGQDWQAHTGTPGAYLQETHGVMRLYPIPEVDCVTGLVVRVSVTPSDTATGIPDNLASAYQDDLTSGAKARLMLYANKPWSNPDFGVKHEADFKAAIDKANSVASGVAGVSRIASRPKWC